MKLSTEQIEALRELLKKNPTTWKAVIRNLWAHSDRVNTNHEHALYALRNRPDFDLRRMTRDFLSAAIETLSNTHKTINAPERVTFEGRESAHHFDKPGVFEVDGCTGAGFSLREKGAGSNGGDLVFSTYKIPTPMLEEIVRLLNEERTARYVVSKTTERGNMITGRRGELSHDADESGNSQTWAFSGYDARARALVCYEIEKKHKPDQITGAQTRIELTRNGAAVLWEG